MVWSVSSFANQLFIYKLTKKQTKRKTFIFWYRAGCTLLYPFLNGHPTPEDGGWVIFFFAIEGGKDVKTI